MNITKNLIIAVLMTIVTTLLLGVAYPLVVTGLAQVLFPRQGERPADRAGRQGRRLANHRSGVLVAGLLPLAAVGRRHRVRCGELRGNEPGPTNKKLVDAVKAAVGRREDGESVGVPVPIDLVTSSASGLDPHISPAAAAFQVPRVARERGVPRRRDPTAGRGATPKAGSSGFLGEPVVNVLELNLSLDAQHPMKK